MSTQLLIRFSYPKQPGDSPWSIIDVIGPHRYQPLQPADPVGPPPTPMGGGQEIFASDFGLQSFDMLIAGMGSNDGRFGVEVIPLLSDGDTFDKALLMWIDLSTGQQASMGEELDGSLVRLLAIGH